MLPLSDPKRRHDFDTDRLVFNFNMMQTPDLPLPLDYLPCAYCEPKARWSCKNEGKLGCSKCELVSYCSKVVPIKIDGESVALTMLPLSTLYRNARLNTGQHINMVWSTLLLVNVSGWLQDSDYRRLHGSNTFGKLVSGLGHKTSPTNIRTIR